MSHETKAVKDFNASKGEVLGVAYGKGTGELHNAVRTRAQSRFRAGGGRMKRGHATLGKAPAHQAENAAPGRASRISES